MTEALKKIVEARWFIAFINVLIVLNALVLGIETFDISEQTYHGLMLFDKFCIAVFVIEILMKLIVQRKDFFRSGWNIFDVIVVGASILPEVMFISSARVLRILRIFRVLRVTRLVGHIKSLRTIVLALLESLPSIGWTCVLLGLIYYIYAIIGTSLFCDIAPEFFGNLWRSLYTLFQITMADDLGNISRPIIAADGIGVVYFVTFIAMSAILVLNIIVGVVVDSVAEVKKQTETEELKESSDLMIELEKLEDQIRVVKLLIEDEENREKIGEKID